MANSKILRGLQGCSQEAVEITRLRTTIHYLIEEQNKASSKLIGVQVLTEQLDKKEEECRIQKSQLKQLEILLSRAENRLAQLSHLHQHGNTGKAIITPGVSKKVLESLTRENTKLKLALEHVLNKNPQGTDLAVENHDLHDLVVALKEELQQTRKETEELRGALQAVETNDFMKLQEQIARLTAELTKAERSLKAKQVFCESVMNENERAKSAMEAVKSERVTQMVMLKKLSNQHPVIKDVIEGAWCGPEDSEDGHKAEIEKSAQTIKELQENLEENGKFVASQQDQIESLKESNDLLMGERRQFDAESMKMQEEFMFEKRKLEEQIRILSAELVESNEYRDLLNQQCSAYENDFKMERQEKEKFNLEIKDVLNRSKGIMQENQILKNENERIKKMVKDEYERKQQTMTHVTRTPTGHQHKDQVPTTSDWSTATGYHPAHFNPMHNVGLVCADGPSEKPTPKPRQHHSASSSSNNTKDSLECPTCKKSIPYDQIEEHLSDCVYHK